MLCTFEPSADELRKCGEARHAACAVVGEDVGQIHVALVAEPVTIVGAAATAGIVRGKLHAVLEHAVGQHGQIKSAPVERHHRRVPLPDEVGKLFQDFRLVGRRVFLAPEGAELLDLVGAVEPQYPEGDNLMKRCRRKAADSRVPNQVRIGNGFDVEDEKRSGHGRKLSEKSALLRLA